MATIKDLLSSMINKINTNEDYIDSEITEVKANMNQIQPLFMDSMEELEANGDTSKLYVLPDNFIYAYKEVADVPSGSTYTNQIPISTDTSGNVVGLIENHRYNSSDVLVELDGVNATGFIPCKKGDKLYFKNIEFGPNSERYGVSYIRFYDSNHALIAVLYGDLDDVKNYSTSYLTDANGYLTSLLVDGAIITDDCAYMRMCFDPTDEEAIVTVNEPIEGSGSTPSGNYTNLAEPLPDNTTDTTKWVNGYRFGSGGITANEGTTLSNSITCRKGDIVRIKGVTLRENSDRIAATTQAGRTDYQYWNAGSSLWTCVLEDDVYVVTMADQGAIDYIRFAMATPTDASQVIITVNEEIVENSGGSTGGYTNLFSTSGEGFANDTDFSGAASGRFLTNYISCKLGDVIHIKGAMPYKAKFHNSVTNAWGDAIYTNGENGLAISNYDSESRVFPITTGTGVSNIDKVQIEIRSGNTDLDSVIITVNEDIVGEPKPSGYKNLADTTSSDWGEDTRMKDSGELSAVQGRRTSNFIPASKGDAIHVKGINVLETTYPASAVAVYDSSKTWLGGFAISTSTNTSVVGVSSYDENVIVVNPSVYLTDAKYDNMAYVRLCGSTVGDASDCVITVNEKIIETEDKPVAGKAWTNTGHAFIPTEYDSQIATLTNKVNANATNINVLSNTTNKQSKDIATLKESVENLESGKTNNTLPSYWEEYLPSKIATIQALQENGGKDCFSFPLLTDIHITVNLGKRSGLIAKRIMDECNMKYAVCCGDVITRGANKTKEQTEQNYASAEELLAPIRPQLLQTQGNHDGSWGQVDLDGDGDVEGEEYYCFNYTPQLNYERIYRKVGLVGDVHFDKSGSGYWIDDVSNKVRYIGMNSHCNKYEENADGTAVYNNMRVFRLTQSQFDMTIEALTTIPNDEWSVLSFSHAPLNNRDGNAFADRIVMRDMLNAYKNKTSYTGTYGTSGNYDYVTVDVDFSSAKGQYIAHFSGHTHTDTVTTDFGIPIITTRCDGKEENDAESNAEKVLGTVTEQSFDIFTVNKAEGKIYATKIGAGSDRVISYDGEIITIPIA